MLSASAPIRFDRKKVFRRGSESYQERFLSLFHRHAYIFKPLSGGAWSSAPEAWCLSDSEILKAIACLHPKFILGSRSAKQTHYAVLDIDSNSKYHSKIQLDRLLKALADAGIHNSTLFRSSYGGGWHLYIFFEKAISSTLLRRELIKLLELNDFRIASGTLEVFPNRSTGSLGNGLRLPLQEGFAWLNKHDLEVEYERAQLSPTKALEFFMDEMESDCNTIQSFEKLIKHNEVLQHAQKQAISPRIPNVIPLKREFDKRDPSDYDSFVQDTFRKLPPGIIASNWYKGRQFHLYGLSAESQRAEAIVTVGHYMFYGDPSRGLGALGYGYEQERELALRKFLTNQHNNLSKDLNSGDPDALVQVERAAAWRPAAKSLTAKYFVERPLSWVLANEKSKIDARQRISNAHNSLKQQQRSFTTIELQSLAGCSRQTLYKHQDIWRSTYEDRKNYSEIAEGFFSACTPEYNAAVEPFVFRFYFFQSLLNSVLSFLDLGLVLHWFGESRQLNQTYLTPEELAAKLRMDAEYVRECCRIELKNPLTIYFLKAYRVEKHSNRWRIIPKSFVETENLPVSERHRIWCQQLLELWDVLVTADDVIWEADRVRSENFEFAEFELFFFQLAQFYFLAKNTGLSKTVALKIELNTAGSFAVESVAYEPFLREFQLHLGKHRLLLKIWRCILGHTSMIEGESYSEYSGQEDYLSQFSVFEICLNCGKSITIDSHEKLYCDTNCGDPFRKWWKSARAKSGREQMKSVCQKIGNLK